MNIKPEIATINRTDPISQKKFKKIFKYYKSITQDLRMPTTRNFTFAISVS